MPMSSPMMTTMFGFLSAAVAGAAAPMSAASTAAEMLAITFDWNRTFMDSSSCSLFSRAAGSRRCPSRRRRPRRPGRQPIGELPGPRLHGVLGIAQLPLRRRRDAAAPPEADRSDHDLLVLGPPCVGVEVAEAHHRVPSAADGCSREATGGGARCQLRADVTPEKWTVHLGFVGDLHLLRRRTAPEDCDRPQAGDADGKTIAPLLLDYVDPHSRLPS